MHFSGFLSKFSFEHLLETLRRYPPAVRIERKCVRDYKLPGTDNVVVKKGSIAVIPVYAIHLDEEYFPDPEKIDPERFSPENKGKIPPYAYLPFGVGPRNCIGRTFYIFASIIKF